MATKKSTAMVAAPSEEALASINNAFPVEAGFTQSFLPRIGMVSQDKTEGRGSNLKVVAEAGTFFIEKQTDEEDEDGKKVWEKEELGRKIEGIIIYKRKQLRHYDSATETFTSSPVYDNDEEVVPLFANKAEVGRGTPKELKAEYEYTDENGKVRSRLEDNRILYVLYEGELYQMNLRGSSMFAYMQYERAVRPSVPGVLTEFTSTEESKGSIEWNKMHFLNVRNLNAEEVALVREKQQEIIEDINSRKSQFAEKNRVDAEFAAQSLGDGK